MLECAWSEPLARWIANRVEWRKPDGRLDRVIRIVRVDRVAEAAFVKVFDVPPIQGEDPVRGATRFQAVVDHRGGGAVHVGSNDVQGTAFRHGKSSPLAGLWRRWLGVIVALLLVGGLVVLRVRRTNK